MRWAVWLLTLTATSSCDVYDRGLIGGDSAGASDDDSAGAVAFGFDAGATAQLPVAAGPIDAAAGAPPDAVVMSAPPPTAAVATVTDADAGAPGAAPIPCGSGECWWSDPLANACRSVRRPTPDQQAAGGESGPLENIYLGWTKLRLGGRDAADAVSDDAWQTFGLDLDGLCTQSSTCGDDTNAVPCLPAGKSIPFDGELCRDNAFASLQPLLAALPNQLGFDEPALNCNLWRGTYNVVMRLSGYDGTSDDPDVRLDVYMSTGLERDVTWTCPFEDPSAPPPRWSASESWQIDRNELMDEPSDDGELPNSRVADAHAYVRDGYLVANIADSSVLRLLSLDPRQRGLAMTLRGTTWLGRLSRAQDGSWQLEDGLLAGRITMDDLTQTVRELGTCEGDAYASAVAAMTDRADLLASGESDPSLSCDALSVGLAFKAAELTPGGAQDSPQRLACCPSGQTAVDCNPVCGDGKVTGAESCDTAFRPWETGACPVTCPSIDACTPQVRTGSACDVRCVPAPITEIGPSDGCCPPGGNANTDVDCPSVCGNGVVEPDETCDPSAAACPVCVSRDPCQIAETLGSADTCDVRCQYRPVEECSAEADGCCPSGCHSLNDGDCVPRCGNAVLESGERCEAGSSTPCDTVCDDLDVCTRDVRTGSVGSCNLVCRHNPITTIGDHEGCCPEGGNANNDEDCAPVCGNRIIEPGEFCDDGNRRDDDQCPADCKMPASIQPPTDEAQ